MTETHHAAAEEPLVLRGSRLVTREWSPNRILLFQDRIEEHDLGFLEKTVQSLRYGQVARVAISRGLFFSELRIESTGGQEIAVQGLRNGRALEAKRMIEERVDHATRAGAPPPAVEAEERLRALARLRDDDLLSADEFERKRREILDGL